MSLFSSLKKGFDQTVVGGFLKGYSVDTSGQEAAARRAQELYKQMYEESIARGEPFLNLGTETAGKFGEYMGVSGDTSSPVYGSLLQTYSPTQLTEDPSYQFRQAEGMKGMERALAAQGKTMSPEAVKALTQYGQNLASTEYQNAYDRYRTGQSDIYNRLLGVTDIGQKQSALQSDYGTNYAANVADLTTSLADSKVAAQEAEKARQSSFYNSLVQGGLTAAMMFSDERLKDNIKKIGAKNGHNIYEFNYKGDDKKYRGVLAQEVLSKDPAAVVKANNGYFKVNYSKLGLEMEEV